MVRGGGTIVSAVGDEDNGEMEPYRRRNFGIGILVVVVVVISDGYISEFVSKVNHSLSIQEGIICITEAAKRFRWTRKNSKLTERFKPPLSLSE